MTVPGYCSRNFSSQATEAASRWLVGSSSSSMSGSDSSRRHSATRRRSPPESFSTFASQSGSRRASAAISSLRSISQPFLASILSCSLPCSSSSLFIASSSMRLGELLADLVEALDQREHLAEAFLRDLPHGLAGGQLRLLGQVADADAGLRPGLAFELLVDARHDAEEGGLAGAIEAEHADLGAGEEAQGDVLEDEALRRDDLAHPVHRENVLRHW